VWVQRKKEVKLAIAIGQKMNREGGGGTGAFVLLTLVCHGRLLELGKGLGICRDKECHGLGEVEEGLEVLASYSPRSIAA